MPDSFQRTSDSDHHELTDIHCSHIRFVNQIQHSVTLSICDIQYRDYKIIYVMK